MTVKQVARSIGNISIECKLTENDIGFCSQPKKHACNSYAYQLGRNENSRCYYTDIGVKYWYFIPEIIDWDTNVDYPKCPLYESFQIIRNILAASISPITGKLLNKSNTLIIYDERNENFQSGSKFELSFNSVRNKLKKGVELQKTTWQEICRVIQEDGENSDLVIWLKEKYGIQYS